jgi:predicted nucleic acid-binding protein
MEAVIVDAGPLVAYLNKDEQDHEWTQARFKELHAPLLTCDAALSEAFFLLQNTHGSSEKLLGLLERGVVVLQFDLRAELPGIGQLLRRYSAVPMSLADACLVRMAELHKGAKVFTLDSDFQIYRKNRRQVIPLIFPE